MTKLVEAQTMKLTARRHFLRLAAGAGALPALACFASAQSYPTRAVGWLVGFAPGSAADTVVRIMARWLEGRLGQPFIIENKPGAATNISVQAAVTAPADGYTLVYLSASTAINASLYQSLPFNVVRDIAPVAGLINFPYVMLVRPAFPAANVAEFISFAKANPGKIKTASFGTGTTSHLACELFKKMTDIDMIHVPYRASAAAHIDLIAGRVDAMFDTLTAPLVHIRSGALRALAMGGKARYEGLPDIPTVSETVPGYDISAWTGVGAPMGTPREIVQQLNREINAGLSDAGVQAQFAQVGTTPIVFTSDEFGAFLVAETVKWAEIVKFSGAKVD